MFFIVVWVSSLAIGNPNELSPSLFPPLLPLPPPLFPPPPPLPLPLPNPFTTSSVMIVSSETSESSGSSTNGEQGGISPSSSSCDSTSSITMCLPVEGKKGSFPNLDSMDGVGESPNSTTAS